MGFACGNAQSSAQDVARFFFDWLGPEPKIVSEGSRQIMQNYTLMDIGWAANAIEYGGGIMKYWFKTGLPDLKDNSTYIGHGGNTYGFQSIQGFFPSMNVSVSLATNQDFEHLAPYL
jgi:hypothetical protein